MTEAPRIKEEEEEEEPRVGSPGPSDHPSGARQDSVAASCSSGLPDKARTSLQLGSGGDRQSERGRSLHRAPQGAGRSCPRSGWFVERGVPSEGVLCGRGGFSIQGGLPDRR